MISTFEVAPRLASEFWVDVALARGSKAAGAPTYVLRNYITNQDGNDVGELLYRACILAWNAHREGSVITSFRVSEKGLRPVISK